MSRLARYMFAVGVAALVGTTAAAASDEVSWSSLNISGRSGHAAVLDPAGHRMLVFGGRTHLGDRADLWALALDPPSRWTRLEARGDAPPAMERMSAIYDPVRQRVIVFGGRDSSTDVASGSATCRTFGEAWALELHPKPRWSALKIRGPAPAPRSGHVAIYDPRRDRMIVFGGERLPDGPYPPGTATERLHDVWALELHGHEHWERIATTGRPPRASARGTAFYDAVDDRMVYAAAGDTLHSLSLVSPAVWSAQSTCALFVVGAGTLEGRVHVVYDAASDLVYRYGGLNVQRLALHGDRCWNMVAWEPPWYNEQIAFGSLDLADGTLVHDPASSTLIAFGGDMAHPGLPVREADALSTSESSPAWTRLGAPEPTNAGDPRLVFDPRSRRLLAAGTDYYRMHVWSWSAGDHRGWSEVVPDAARWPAMPRARIFTGLVADSARGRLLVFGGGAVGPYMVDLTLAAIGDLWAFDLGDDPHWYELTSASNRLRPRIDPVTLVDPSGERLLVIGGLNYSSDIRADTLWSLALDGPSQWIAHPIPGPSPPLIRGSQAVFDSKRGRLLALYHREGTDLWSLDLDGPLRWESLGPTILRPWYLLYDPPGDQIVDLAPAPLDHRFGGLSVALRDLTMGAETEPAPDLSPQEDWPSERVNVGAAYDPLTDRIMMFGGRDAPLQSLTDTWFLELPRVKHPQLSHGPQRLEEKAPRHVEPLPLIRDARLDAASGGLRLALDLARGAPARASVYDLAGRRVAAVDVLPSMDGAREVVIPLGATCRPGVYFVGVAQAGRYAGARVVWVR